MKREYDNKNKRNIVIIMVLSLLVIGIFSLFIYRYMKSLRVSYEISAGSVVQDIKKNYVAVDIDSELKIRWNDNYYLMYQDKQVDLGKKVISYNTITGQMNLYGSVYKILDNGQVLKTEGETVLENVTQTSFYKLADREYLLVDRVIVSEDRSIEANNYLLVELDRLGNAKLSNNSLNLKTISPTVLVTSQYKFDIANEILTYGEVKIDLKKIIGTTNKYEPVKEETPKDLEQESNGGNGGSNIGTGNGQGQGNDNTVINKKDDLSGEVTDIEEIKKKTKMTSVVRVFEGLTQVDFDYVIYDPYNEYQSVYVEVTKDKLIEKIELNKSETHLVVNGLIPGREYKFKFVYTTVDDDDLIVSNTFDEMTLKTKMPSYTIGVQKISKVNNTLTYRVKLDDNYNIDKVVVRLAFNYNLLGSDEKVSMVQELAVSAGSKYVSGVFDISDYNILKDTMIELKILEVYAGDIKLDILENYTFRFGR